MNKKVIQEFTATNSDIGIRLDLYLTGKMDITRSRAQKIIRDQLIKVGGNAETAKYTLQKGDLVSVFAENKTEVPEIPIIFEDKDILVIDKPAGITTHPAPGENDVTISEIFEDKYTGKMATERDNIVHRLDKGTSGLMVLAKHESAREALAKQFATRGVNKKYLALVVGRVTPKEGIIDMPLARDLVSKNRIAPADEGKDAKTLYKVEQYYGGYTLVSANPKTGRTHQIRVHFSAIGHPLYGDLRYGASEKKAKRIFLHAAELSFLHPRTGERVSFKSKLPVELDKILGSLTIE